MSGGPAGQFPGGVAAATPGAGDGDDVPPASASAAGTMSAADFIKLSQIGYQVFEVASATQDYDLPIPGGPTVSGDVEIVAHIIGATGTLALRPDALTTNQSSLAVVGNSTPVVVAADGPTELQLGDISAGGDAWLDARLSCFIGKQHRFRSDCFRDGINAIWVSRGAWRAATDPTFARIHHSVAGGIHAGSWFAVRKIGLQGGSSAADPLIAVDETNKSESIKISGRGFVNAANDIWNGNVVTRYNPAGTVRLLNWTPTTLVFQAVGMFAPVNASQIISVLVNGAFFTSVTIAPVSSPVEYTVSGLPAGAKRMDLIEGFQAVESGFDNGTDHPVSGAYVTGVRVPTGQSAPSRATASTGTVCVGDSILFGSPNQPWTANGWVAQVRTAAHAVGQLVTALGPGAGTEAGDGFSAAEMADMISDGWAAMGCTSKNLVWLRRPNDFKYWDIGGSVHTTPDQLVARVGAVLDALTISDPGYSAYIVAPFIPQGTAMDGPNLGGFFRQVGGGAASYSAKMVAGIATGRPQVTLLAGTSWGLSLATDYDEAAPNQIHPDQSGHDKIAAVIKTALGIP